MFWRLFLLREHSTRELASIVCDNEQCELFCSGGPTPQSALATAKTGKIRERSKNEGKWTGKVHIYSRKKSMEVGEACAAIF